ncbi:GntR family transcriptional regulator [Nocardia africana]|uniref:GntR family transcriptional regulator n=1 Tax=Nocardia africana TaxID=134964 RepID=A0ABW6NU28_9NOCA
METVTTSSAMKRDQIVDELRRQILTGELARGERMPQDELARRFGASITPVREAMRLLEAEGLVTAEPHRGVRVAAVDLERIKGIYVVRRLAESYAMRRASSRISRRDLALARELQEQMADAAKAADRTAFRELNRRFHFLFYDRCGIPALRDQIHGMWQAFPWDLMLDSEKRMTASNKEHMEIIDALDAGDADMAAAATERHIRHGFAAISERLLGNISPDPFELDVD